MIPNMEVFGSLVQTIHGYLTSYFYLALPIAMVFSICIGFLRAGDPRYPDVVKRAFVACLLLASFPEMSNLILDLCDGLAQRIDSMQGLDAFIKMAEERARSNSISTKMILIKHEDLAIAILNLLSFVVLLIARVLSIGVYYFFWVLLSALAPLMILFYIFPATAGITVNLYRGLIEVAFWKVLWAVMSAMLAALSFGNMQKTDGSYLTVVVMNFVIAIALLRTPVVMKSLIGSGVQGLAQDLGTSATMAVASIPLKVANAKAALANPSGFVRSHIRNYDKFTNNKGGKKS